MRYSAPAIKTKGDAEHALKEIGANWKRVNYCKNCENKFKKDLNHEDKLVLGIISDILENYHMFDIYNKKQLYLYIREATDLPSRKITKTINKIKNRYIEAKKELMDVR